MHRRTVTVTVSAVFAIGAAFAAQPTSLRADWGEAGVQQELPWSPGTASLMSTHDPNPTVMAAPQ